MLSVLNGTVYPLSTELCCYSLCHFVKTIREANNKMNEVILYYLYRVGKGTYLL